MISYADDELPDGQVPIKTKNVGRLNGFMRMITDPRREYPTMGVVTGQAGLGKTISIQHYLNSEKPRVHTGLPASVRIKVKPRSTSKALAYDIVVGLRDHPRGRNVYEVADEAAAAMARNDLKLLIVDEADRLNEESFEVLRHIFDRTGCSIVVVGLPTILKVIDTQEKFASRIGLRMTFEPPTWEEFSTLILPQLVFPHWKFDPNDQNDLALGEYIWEIVNPSFRKLRNLLQAASQVADHTDEDWITRELIDYAFEFTANTADMKRMKGTPKPATGSPEEVSERRHNAKKKANAEPI